MHPVIAHWLCMKASLVFCQRMMFNLVFPLMPPLPPAESLFRSIRVTVPTRRAA